MARKTACVQCVPGRRCDAHAQRRMSVEVRMALRSLASNLTRQLFSHAWARGEGGLRCRRCGAFLPYVGAIDGRCLEACSIQVGPASIGRPETSTLN